MALCVLCMPYNPSHHNMDSLSFQWFFPANMRCWPNVGFLLGQRRRRWANSKPTLCQHLMFARLYVMIFNQRENRIPADIHSTKIDKTVCGVSLSRQIMPF